MYAPKFAAAMMRELNSLPLDKYDVQRKPHFRLRVGIYREVQLDLIPVIEVFHMLFERCHTKIERDLSNSMYSLGRQVE